MQAAATNFPHPGAFAIDGFGNAYDICRSQVFKEIQTGRLKSFKVGRRRLISYEAAESWQRAREIETGTTPASLAAKPE